MSQIDAARRAGTLSMINIITLFATENLTIYTDIFRILHLLGLQMHRATAWMVASLTGQHIVLVITTQNWSSLLTNSNNLFAFIVC